MTESGVLPENDKSSMRIEHRRWSAEHDVWRTDAEGWQEELRKAMDELDDVWMMLHDYELALKAHLDLMAQHQKFEDEHEQALDTAELLATPVESQDPMKLMHAHEAESHRQQRDVHERMNMHHQAFMTAWAVMVDALRRTM